MPKVEMTFQARISTGSIIVMDDSTSLKDVHEMMVLEVERVLGLDSKSLDRRAVVITTTSYKPLKEAGQ